MAWQAKPTSVSLARDKVILTVDYQNTDDTSQNFTQNMEVQNMANEAELVQTIRGHITAIIKARAYFTYLQTQISNQVVITETGVLQK